MKRLPFISFITLFTLSVYANEQTANSQDLQVEMNKNRQDINLTLDKILLDRQIFATSRMQRIKDHSQKFNRIVGGRNADINSFSWMVAFSYYDFSGELKNYCGGTLIGDRWILTAAHCEVLTTDIAVIGRYNLDSNSGQEYQIKQFIPHKSYDPDTSDNDIALVELESNVTNSSFVSYKKDEKLINVGSKVTTLGWGRLSENGELSKTLQKVELITQDYNDCKKIYSNLTKNMICAGGEEGKDSCQGDSGGPLTIKIGESWLQLGVVSFGYGCARKNIFGVYTHVANYIGWIDELIND